MLHADRLRALADLQGPDRAFLSAYLGDAAERSVLDNRVGEIQRLLAGQPDELEQFERNWARAQELLDEAAVPQDGGLAVFTCWATDLAHVEPVPVPVQTELRVGASPYVRPLYEVVDEHQPYAVAVVDNSAARLFLVTPGDAELERRVSGGVKNRVKVGGWSQKRYARRREGELADYANTVADALQTLADEHAVDRLVLLGADEARQAVEAALPTGLADRLVGSEPVASDATEGELLDAAAEVSAEGERQEEQSLWEQIEEHSLGGGLAVLGPTPVLEALTAARAEAVLLDREAEIPGTRCRACEHVMHGTPDTCQRCGASDVFETELGEQLVELAAGTGATVDFVDPFEALGAQGGVAALLRY